MKETVGKGRKEEEEREKEKRQPVEFCMMAPI